MGHRQSRLLMQAFVELVPPQVVCFGFAIVLAGLFFGTPAVMALCAVLLLFVPFCIRIDRGRGRTQHETDDELDRWKTAHASMSADLPPVVRLRVRSHGRMGAKAAVRRASVS